MVPGLDDPPTRIAKLTYATYLFWPHCCIEDTSRHALPFSVSPLNMLIHNGSHSWYV
jgi:hypothetical protein